MCFCRKIVSESRVMVNGLDINGMNQQRSDLNNFTDGQPFAPVPQIDWSSGHATAVVPMQGLTTEHMNSAGNFISDKKVQVENSGSASVDKGAIDDRANNSTDLDKKEPADDLPENTNSNNSNDQSLVVSDSVKLPPSSSLFSHLKNSETSSVVSGDSIHENTGASDSVFYQEPDVSNDSQSATAITDISSKATEELDVTQEKAVDSESTEAKCEADKPGTGMSDVFEESYKEDAAEGQPQSGADRNRDAETEDRGEPPEKKVHLSAVQQNLL